MIIKGLEKRLKMKTETGFLKTLFPKPRDEFCPRCGMQMNSGAPIRTKRFCHFILVCDDCDLVVASSEALNES